MCVTPRTSLQKVVLELTKVGFKISSRAEMWEINLGEKNYTIGLPLWS